MPMLMMMIFLVVQFSLLYLGNQVISSAARQAARVVRTGGSIEDAKVVARNYAEEVGFGLVTNVDVSQTKIVPGSSGDEVQVVVTGDAMQLVPAVAAGRVSKTVQGPLETYRPDVGQ